MLTTLYYFLQVIICSGIMMGYYWLVLRNKRFHQYNRFYLLAIALFSWIVPLIKIQWNEPAETDQQIIQFFSVIADNNSTIDLNLQKNWLQFSWQSGLMLIYALVGIVLLSGLIKSLIRIYQLLKTHSCKSVGDVYLVLTQANNAPFSFFRYIFWHESVDLKSDTGKQMMQHELIHVKQKHSIDKIVIQLVIIVGWFNPFFWLMKKEMDMIHEFIADNKTVANGDAASLAQLLLAAAYPQHHQLLTNPFFFSPIKRRLQMITNTKNPRFSYLRRLVVLPLLAIVVVLFAFRSKELRNAETISVGTIMTNIVDQIAKTTSTVRGAKNIPLSRTYNIVIHAGHGGADDGAIGIDGVTTEKMLTLELAKKVLAANENDQLNIILTRESDIFQSSAEVATITNQQKPDLFISLHCNADVAKNVVNSKNGMEIYITEKAKTSNYSENYLLANQMANNLSKLAIPFAGIKSRKEGIYVLQIVKSPSILIETGYISNSSDLQKLKDKTFQQNFATSLLNGIQYYLANKENITQKDTTILSGDSVYIIPKNKTVQVIHEGSNKPALMNSKGTVTVVGYGMPSTFSNSSNDKGSMTFTRSFSKDSVPPLYILDGKKIDEADMKTLNLNTIQKIDVLKDKSAEAQYGPEGKHGVVSITTKKKVMGYPIEAISSQKDTVIVIGKPSDKESMVFVERKLNGSDIIEVPMQGVKVVKGYKLNSNPLVVVNDMPVSVNINELNIDQKNIVSVNILKGESATKKYGIEAEHGAIEIKTKNSDGVNLNMASDPSGIKAFLKKNPEIKMVSWNHNPLRMNLTFKDGSLETYDLSNASSVEKAMKKYGKLSLPTPPPPPPSAPPIK